MRTSLVWILVATVAHAAPPGVEIAHSPAASGIYVGSPSLAILPTGTYVASHDEFGPKSSMKTSGTTRIFASSDRGASWSAIASFDDAFWGTLFVRDQTLYWLGTTKQYGDVAIRSSADEGKTWTAAHVLVAGAFHCAPTPVVVAGGRIWRAFEDRGGPGGWPRWFEAVMISAPATADLMKPASWTQSNAIAGDQRWRGGRFRGWLEGNAIATADGRMVDVLRVADGARDEHAAIVEISSDGKTARFDPALGFIELPGGAKKFTIRYDATSRLYWSLANYVPPAQVGHAPDFIRNTLALVASPDLHAWSVRSIVLAHPDRAKHGFQYVDWQFDGDDLVAVSRTAFDDDAGGAHSMHDANYLTFHRVAGFRTLAPADMLATEELAIHGEGFTIDRLANRAKAFANRSYAWRDVPARFDGWSYTQVAGGHAATITVRVKRDTTMFAATAGPADGWTATDDSFTYDDAHSTRLSIVRRAVHANDELVLPQTTWSGMILLVPPHHPP